MIRIATILLIFTSCSQFDSDYINSVHPEIEPYYSAFIQDGKDRGADFSLSSIVLQFDELEGGIYGISIKEGNYYAKIFIDRSEWDLLNEADRYYTVYHELGHALLDRRHEDHNGSIMSSSRSAMNRFANEPIPMINELFE